MPISRDIIDRWTKLREEFRLLRITVDGVAIADAVLRDLEQLDQPEPFLTLREAAVESGYTPDHLSRLVRQGKVTNYGRERAPRFRASELPRKPTRRLAGAGPRAYDVAADARSLQRRR